MARKRSAIPLDEFIVRERKERAPIPATLVLLERAALRWWREQSCFSDDDLALKKAAYFLARACTAHAAWLKREEGKR